MHRIFKIIHIKPGFYVLLAIYILILPAKWLWAWLIALCVHEISHVLALLLFDVEIEMIELCGLGVTIEIPHILPVYELVSAIAGPIGGMLPILFSANFPELTLCSAILSFFNLLPVYPMDGGRIIYSLIKVCFPTKNAYKVSMIIERLFFVAIAVFTIILCIFKRMGIGPMLISVFAIIRANIRKSPCKATKQIVQ